MAYGLVGGVGDHGRHGTLITEEIVNAAKLDTAECIEIRQNNIEQVEKALLRAYKTGLEEIGLVAEGYAKAGCATPSRTYSKATTASSGPTSSTRRTSRRGLPALRASTSCARRQRATETRTGRFSRST